MAHVCSARSGSRRLSQVFPLGNAARATRAVLSGTGMISFGWSDMGTSRACFPNDNIGNASPFAPSAPKSDHSGISPAVSNLRMSQCCTPIGGDSEAD
jgi:hypothetical protein